MADGLLEACKAGDFFRARLVIQRGCDPKTAIKRAAFSYIDYESGYTPLHYSCEKGDLGFVQFLVETHSCNPHRKSVLDITPLHLACRSGSIELVKYLVTQCKCDVTCTDRGKETPLHYACRGGSVAVVRYLITELKCDRKQTNNGGQTSLHLACRSGSIELVKYLVTQCKCDVTSTTRYKRETPLHFACRGGSVAVVRYLITELKCDPEQTNQYGETSLHLACEQEGLQVVQYLVGEQNCNKECTDKGGRTPLHWAVRNRHREIVTYLLKEGNCNPNSTTSNGDTPLTLANDPSIIRELLRHGADPKNDYAKCSKYLPAQCPTQPAESVVNVFVVGDTGAGKSTLTKALKVKAESSGLWSRFINRMTKVSDVEKKTAGIVPHELDSKTFGAVTLYDFAGHKEFYASHDAIVRNTVTGSSAAIFLTVIDMCKSDTEFQRRALYWLQFIQDQCSSVRTKPHVILIGSHDDEVKSMEERLRKISIMESIQALPEFSNLHFCAYRTMNCCYGESPSLSNLCTNLERSCKVLRSRVVMSMRNHCFHIYLLEQFRDSPAILLSTLLNAIGEKTESEGVQLLDIMPRTLPELCTSCEKLNERGHILFLKNADAVDNSWIILDKVALLSQVTGTVFAPEGFRQHHFLATSTGVVPFSKIGTCISELNLNPDMIAKYLCHLEFCQEITDPEVLQLLQREYTVTPASSTSSEKFYFFPSLVNVTAPSEAKETSCRPESINAQSAVWKKDQRFGYHCCWMLQCPEPEHSKPKQFLTPRFLQVLLLRLAFSFAFAPDKIDDSSDNTPILQKECTVWKNGLQWTKLSGIETLVEVVDKSVTVLLRCLKGQEIECIRFRSAIIQKILLAMKEFCPTVSTSEYFIHPDDATQYPLKPFPEITLVSCTEIAKAVADSKPAARNTKRDLEELQPLLHFEPYALIEATILQKLFDQHSPTYTTVMSDHFLNQIAKSTHVYHVSRFVTRVLCPLEPPLSDSVQETIRILRLWRTQSSGTYQALRDKLDKFSVFAGRNPLEMSGVHVQPTEGTPPSEQDTALCDPPTMMELIRFRGKERRINIPQEISTQCRQFGILLLEDSTGARVQNIAETCRGNPEQMNLEILRQWLDPDGKGKQPVTWTTLVEILRDSELTNLAKDIQAVKVMTHTPI